MICEIRRSLLAALRIAVVCVLVVVLAAPLVGAEDFEEGEEPDSEPVTDGEGEDHGNATSCDDLYALGEWTESQYSELMNCLFGLPGSSANDSSPVSGKTPSDSGRTVRQSASECGRVNIEYVVSQYIPRSRFGFVVGHDWVYFMMLTCEDGSPAVGYRTGLQEIAGPNSGRYSQSCSIRRGSRVVEVPTSNANGCQSYIGSNPSIAGTAHLHSISHRNDRRFRQVLIWADLNGNGRYDGGEPYDIAFSPDDGTATSFSISETIGSVARRGGLAGQQVVLVDSLGVPLGGSAIGADVVTGPNQGAAVMCRSTRPRPISRLTQRESDCTTGGDGRITLTYRARSGYSVLERHEFDVLRVFLDTDGNGRFSAGEPFQYTTIRIAKPINYVALGDSYSSGEAGEDDDHEFEGNYRTGKPADPECRRWDMAYPFNVDDYLVGGDFTIDTYACTGAITLNIHDPGDLAGTRRPSHVAEEFETEAEQQDDDREPRQAQSLEQANVERSVDMVTLTIGGNDAGFGDVIKKCLGFGSCMNAEPENPFSTIETRVVDVLSEIRSAVPGASIFVLGYPYLVPSTSDRDSSCLSLTPSGVLSERGDFINLQILGSFLNALSIGQVVSSECGRA